LLKKISFYFYVFYCFEVGIFLLVVPWKLPQVWEQNYFFAIVPQLKIVFLNGFFRGAVSGLGLVNICLGIFEIIERERMRHFLES